MDSNTVAHNEHISPRYTTLNCRVGITQRICLWCNWWMRSTNPAHRKCNHCKRDFGGSAMRVGNRIRPVEGIVQAPESWSHDIVDIQADFSNVLHLGNIDQVQP